MPHDIRPGRRSRSAGRGDDGAGRGRGERGDDGFVLLESIIAIALTSVLMGALTPFFANSISLMSRERATQVATQLATTGVETVRGLPASDLVTDHGSGSVSTQFTSAPPLVQPWLDGSLMTPAVDSAAAAGAGSAAVVPTSAQTQTVNNVVYAVTTYLGWCQIPSGGSAASCSSAASSDSVRYLRAVVAVTWSASSCPTTGCAYVTGTLVSATGDPIFNLKQAPPAVPLVVGPGNQTSTVGTGITPLQLAVQPGTGVPTMSWAVTSGSLPAGLALTPAGLISGTPTTITAAVSVTVTVTDAFQRTAGTTFTWTVVSGPTVVSPGAQRSSVGASVNQALTTSCPASPCTYTLANGPAGLSVTPAGVITGTITSSAQTFPAVSVTVTDDNGATATSASFTWTVVAAPAVTSPGARTTTTGGAVSIALVSACANSPCTYTLNGGPAGLTISSAGLLSGTVTSPAQTFASVTITVTDQSGTSATSTAFPWYVVGRPTVTSPGAQTTTVGATVSLALTTSCPNPACTYTLSNGPAGLTVSAAGVVSGTVTSAPQTFPAVTVTVTDASGVSAGTASFSWTVLARPSVTAPPNQTSTSGAAATAVTLTKSCPNTPCTYSLNDGPGGLTISSAGVISGTVTSAAQVFRSVSVTVTDAAGVSATSGTFTWTVTYSAVSATQPPSQKSTRGTAITPLQLSSTGGSGSVTWSLVRALPAGLSLSSSGLITGTPTAVGSTTVSVKVTDASAGSTSTVSFTWVVVTGPTIGNPGSLSTSVGATPSVALAYTCPYAACTITLAGTVPGLGLSTASTSAASNGTTSVTVTSTSGTVYVNGVVQSSAVTSGTSTTYAPTLTIADGAGATAVSSAGSWTVSVSTCAATTRAAGAYFAYPLADSSGTTAADVSGNGRSGSYRSTGVTYGQAGPCPRDSGKAVTFDGSNGYAVYGASTGNVQVFSAQVWFRSTTTNGGKLIGYGNSNSLTGGTSSTYDRHIYMRNDGALVFGVYNGGVNTVTTSRSYNDGAWHQVVGTLAPASDANPGLRLYVDGALVASDTSVVSAESVSSGYWHVGFDNLSGWPNTPNSNFFGGSMAWASVYGNALTPTQVSTMWNAGN